MQKDQERIELALRLKKSLVEYYRQREKKFKPLILSSREIKGERDEINAVDWFIHCYRFRNGDSLIDRFIKENNSLSRSELAILEGWKESFEGIFEVKSVNEDTIRLYNLIDEAEYTATSNLGKQGLKRISAGEFIVTRLVPLDDIYLLSGVSLLYPAEAGSMLEEEALKIVKSNLPASLGKNKEKWAQAWQMQKKFRSEFIAYFGDEIIVVPGDKLQETMEEFLAYYTEKAKSKLSEPEKAKYAGLKSTFPVPGKLAGADSAGVIIDETEGLHIYTDFQLFMEPFKNPELIKDEEYKEAILGYLWSDTISPLPFRKMVERYPENARKVFAALFNKRNWRNEKDFPALLRKYKGAFLKEKPRPTVIPATQKMRSERSR